jgi:hypothetical protein
MQEQCDECRKISGELINIAFSKVEGSAGLSLQGCSRSQSAFKDCTTGGHMMVFQTTVLMLAEGYSCC